MERKIEYMAEQYVCMFWVVNDKLWLEKTSLDIFKKSIKDFHERRVITFRQAHVREWGKWCEKYDSSKKDAHFMYYPRGRVSNFPRINKFELVIDPCLINAEHVDTILKACGIDNNNTYIVTQSDDQTLHYICHNCRPDAFDTNKQLNESVSLL